MGALDLALPNGPPDSVEGWRAAAQALLSPPCCAFHRNMEISSRYAWLNAQHPTGFKWAGMAAIASHHARLVLFPFRLDADRNGYVDLPRSLSRRLLTGDANRMRQINNAIYDDIFWVHLAYLASGDGIQGLRRLLGPYREYAGLLSGFETIDRGAAVLSDERSSQEDRRDAADQVWAGNLALLEHEQRVVVQPLFESLSGMFARLISMGATTTFEVRGVRQQVRYFTSFSAYSLTRGLTAALRARSVPRITRFEDRWPWLEASVVPRFRRLDSDQALVTRTLGRVVEAGKRYGEMPCLIPPNYLGRGTLTE
ncbi:DUF2515 family protein [Allobranchiibius huperziae]|uniref:Uncharacterized protein n=1 Tax=Allobranchiibius huperziae TaxID=1874116 RepID=A0A853DEW6_9MICO|nr:hypothetical protein [Allobranchiibius huperziae]NYJ73451.1 hypothetical protein [Allobranchiibius huperziae]